MSDPDRTLPLDSDLDVAETQTRRPRPVHLRVPYIGLVAAGGTVGTAARLVSTLAFPPLNGFAVATFSINASGAFLLGLLLELITRLGPDEGARRTLRLLLGTGVLGGFTTYSALATDAATLTAHGQALTAAFYAFGTLLLGGLATWCGITAGAAAHDRLCDRRRASS